MDLHLDALRASAARLRATVSSLDDSQLDTPAYPTEWSIAEVLSHIGSSAVIMQRRLEDALGGTPMPEDFAPGVWATWNAKASPAMARDAVEADGALVERLGSLTDDERSRFRSVIGPLELDAPAFVAMRLNEHAMHTWDVEVALDPAATLPPDATPLIVDNLDLLARFTARPTGADRTIVVHTTDPARAFTVTLAPERATFAAGDGGRPADLTMPAEAFVRLVYGRLDPSHRAAVEGDPTALDHLRLVFPGP
jgi:uncharacterized protein (TIGR03083 family)